MLTITFQPFRVQSIALNNDKTEGGATANKMSKLLPDLMAILASRLHNISIQMNIIMVRSSKSTVLALAREGSPAILDANGKLLTYPSGFRFTPAQVH